MTDDAVVGRDTLGFATGDERRGDIADADAGDAAGVPIDFQHGDSGAAGGAQALVQDLHEAQRRSMFLRLENTARLGRRHARRPAHDPSRRYRRP